MPAAYSKRHGLSGDQIRAGPGAQLLEAGDHAMGNLALRARAGALAGHRRLPAWIMVGTDGSLAPRWPVEVLMNEISGTTPAPGAARGSAVLRYAAFTDHSGAATPPG